MKTLIEDLHDNNVIFSYYGFIDESVLNEVLRITHSKLDSIKESKDITQKVSEILRDCADNIIQHNFYPEDARVKYKSLIVVAKQAHMYHIDCIHKVNQVQKAIFDEHMDYLNSQSKEELKRNATKNFVQTASVETLTAPAIIELTLKADVFSYNIKPIEDNFLLNIHFEVNSKV